VITTTVVPTTHSGPVAALYKCSMTASNRATERQVRDHFELAKQVFEQAGRGLREILGLADGMEMTERGRGWAIKRGNNYSHCICYSATGVIPTTATTMPTTETTITTTSTTFMTTTSITRLAPICCDTIRITNLKVTNAQFSRVAEYKGRYLYADSQRQYGMWFDGGEGVDADWILGELGNIYTGKENWGDMASDEDTPCPDQVKDWKELENNSWTPTNATVKCERDLKFQGTETPVTTTSSAATFTSAVLLLILHNLF